MKACYEEFLVYQFLFKILDLPIEGGSKLTISDRFSSIYVSRALQIFIE